MLLAEVARTSAEVATTRSRLAVPRLLQPMLARPADSLAGSRTRAGGLRVTAETVRAIPTRAGGGVDSPHEAQPRRWR